MNFLQAWKTKVLIKIWHSNLFEWDYVRGAQTLSWMLWSNFVQPYAQKERDFSILWYSLFWERVSEEFDRCDCVLCMHEKWKLSSKSDSWMLWLNIVQSYAQKTKFFSSKKLFGLRKSIKEITTLLEYDQIFLCKKNKGFD